MIDAAKTSYQVGSVQMGLKLFISTYRYLQKIQIKLLIIGEIKSIFKIVFFHNTLKTGRFS